MAEKKIGLNLANVGTHEDAPLAEIVGDILVLAMRLEPNPYVSSKVVRGPDNKPLKGDDGNPVIRDSKGVIVVSTHGFKMLEGAEFKGLQIKFSATGTVTKPKAAGEPTEATNGTVKKFVEL